MARRRKRRTRERGYDNEDEEDRVREQPAANPMDEPREQPDRDDEILEVLSNLQDSVAQLNQRVDKIENRPLEDEEQEVPAMEAQDYDDEEGDVPGEQDVGPDEREEEVNVGGDDEPSDFEDMDQRGKQKGPAKEPEYDVEAIRKKMGEIMSALEELRGVPEKPQGKDEKPIGPEGAEGVPQSQQPPAGEAPSGGGFDADDNKAEDEERDAVDKVEKPERDYNKPAVAKNAAKPQNDAEDPTNPQPGADEDDPDEMDMNNPAEKLYRDLQNEVGKEALTRRQSVVENARLSKEQRMKTEMQKNANEIVKEYLGKNYSRAARYLTPNTQGR